MTKSKTNTVRVLGLLLSSLVVQIVSRVRKKSSLLPSDTSGFIRCSTQLENCSVPYAFDVKLTATIWIHLRKNVLNAHDNKQINNLSAFVWLRTDASNAVDLTELSKVIVLPDASVEFGQLCTCVSTSKI